MSKIMDFIKILLFKANKFVKDIFGFKKQQNMAGRDQLGCVNAGDKNNIEINIYSEKNQDRYSHNIYLAHISGRHNYSMIEIRNCSNEAIIDLKIISVCKINGNEDRRIYDRFLGSKGNFNISSHGCNQLDIDERERFVGFPLSSDEGKITFFVTAKGSKTSKELKFSPKEIIIPQEN